MDDDLGPMRNANPTPLPFRTLVRSRGRELSAALRNDLQSVKKKTGFVLFRIEPYHDILKDVMSRFANEIFSQHYPVNRLDWRKISVITTAAEFDENTFSDTEEDLWLLPLYFEDEERRDKIGEPISVHTKVVMANYDIYLAYRVAKAT